MPESNDRPAANVRGWTLQRWGALASFLMPVALIVGGFIQLTGSLESPLGRFAYDLADSLGLVWAATLITAVLALRERIGERAPRRMELALLAAALAAAAIVGVACIRFSNRHYVLRHLELDLTMSISETALAQAVIIVWTTILSGITAAGWHFLGWAFVLIDWAGWTTRRLPRVLCALVPG